MGESACSPQSGHSSSTCSSPPATASTATNHNDVSSTTSTSTCIPTNFTSSWSILGETTGIKSEIRSPGLAENDVAALSQDPLSFYGTAAELSNLYDKDYPQTYSAQQYYNRWCLSRFFHVHIESFPFLACNKLTAQRTPPRQHTWTPHPHFIMLLRIPTPR